MLWLKSFHIMSVIAWMAGLFYLPRLYVYHAQTPKEEQASQDRFVIMERKLLNFIMKPAAYATLFSGSGLIWFYIDIAGGDWFVKAHWLHLKLLFVTLMFIFHYYCHLWFKGFEAGTHSHDQKFFRYMNEIPTVLMILIVLLVELKPFY